MSRPPLRARSLICSQICGSERPCHPIDCGARCQSACPGTPEYRNWRRDGRWRTSSPARRAHRPRAPPAAGAAACARSGSGCRQRDDSSCSADARSPCRPPGTARSSAITAKAVTGRSAFAATTDGKACCPLVSSSTGSIAHATPRASVAAAARLHRPRIMCRPAHPWLSPPMPAPHRGWRPGCGHRWRSGRGCRSWRDRCRGRSAS